MEIDLDIFRAFVDQNQPPDVINQVNAFMQKNIVNPQFALFILNSYQAQEVQNDQIIIQAMALVLFRIIGYVWTKLYPNQLDQYDKDTYTQIREGIISICLNTPPAFQPIIIDSIREIISKEGYNSEDLVSNACSLITQQQDLHIFSLVFQILESYSDVVKFPKQTNPGEPFCETFMQIWLAILPQLQESFSTQPQADSYQIVKNASEIMKNLLNCATDSLLKTEVSDLVQFFINTLAISNNEVECIKMKESVLLFFKEALTLTQNIKRRNYTEWIQQVFLENIFQLIPQLYPTISESSTIGALSALMNIFLNMILYEISKEWFYSPEFVYNYLVPSARLTPNDLEEFESSPAHYIGSSISFLNDDRADNYDIPRLICARIVQIMISRAQELFSIELSQFSNPLDLEAYLYLIYQGYLLRKASFTIDEETYSQIFTLLNTSGLPEYIYPSTLCALQNNLILHNYDLLKTISSSAYEIIMNHEMSYVFVIPALTLFRLTIKSLAEKNELESLIDMKEFIERLVQISSEINTPAVQEVMKNLIENWNSPQIREISRELFVPFSEFLIEISKLENSNDISPQQEDELNRIADNLYLLFKINIQADFGEGLYFAEQIITLTVNILQQYPNSIGVATLIDLCLNVCQKINLDKLSDEFKSILVKFVHFINTYLSSLLSTEESFDLYLFQNFAAVLSALMPIIEDELLQQTQAICFNIFQHQNAMIESSLSAALLVLSNIILVHGANINEITQFAIEQMKSTQEQSEADQELYYEVSNISITCIFVLTSALFKTEGSFAQCIPEDILQKWFELSNVFNLQSQREIHTFALGLLILASQENADAYKVAAKLLLQNYEKETNPLFEEEEECCDNDDLLNIPFSLDNENVSKLFLQLVEKFGPPDDYSKDFHEWLSQKAYETK